MDRREFLASAAALAASQAADQTATQAKSQYFELLQYRLHQGDQGRRLNEYFSQRLLPLMKKHRAGLTGFFNVSVGPTPMLVGLYCHASLAEKEAASKRLGSDPELGKAVEALEGESEAPVDRTDSVLLHATPYSPEPAAHEAGKTPRVFELRVYETPTLKHLTALNRRFADHTVKLFAKHGFGQIFYGETRIGNNMPNLTYMLAFDSLDAREKCWNAFRSDPDWIKARDASLKESGQIVSRVTNWLLTPTAYSVIQ